MSIHSSFSLLFAFILALTVGAAAGPIVVRDSPVSIKLAKRFNFTGSTKLIEHDQARIALLRSRVQARINGQPSSDAAVVSVGAVNQVVEYTATVRRCYT